jgi:hypothetical protein
MKNKIIYLTISFVFYHSILAQRLRHNEMLGRPTDHSVTVQMFFADSVEFSVKYGLSSANYSGQTAWLLVKPDDPAEVVLEPLLNDTVYYYAVCYRKPKAANYIQRQEHHFRTARPKGKKFTFIIQADPHLDEQSDTNVYNLCLQNQLQDNPDFMVDLGDFLMSDKLRNSSKIIPRDTITYRCHLLRKNYEKIAHSVPLYIAIGNHEGESGWNLTGKADNVAIWGTLDRKKYFLNPAPDAFYSGDTNHFNFVGQRENYYAWEWGDALFIVLDPYWYTSPKPDSLNGWRWTLGKGQYNWLKSTLEKSGAKYKFVFAHQIIGGNPDGRGGTEYAGKYEWGGNNLDGSPGFAINRPGWYKPIKDLLTENKVTVFFHGHDHFFGRQEKECLVYQETPQPSHPNFTSVTYAKDYGYVEGQILPNSGHLRITVEPVGVKVEYVRVYLPKNENAGRHNKDVSAMYFIGATNCYDSLASVSPILWNNAYADEIIYPNPFDQSASIKFEQPESGKVNLEILNANGQTIRNLLNNFLPRGTFQLSWDGKNNSGMDVPSGVYFYSITQENGKKLSGKIIRK